MQTQKPWSAYQRSLDLCSILQRRSALSPDEADPITVDGVTITPSDNKLQPQVYLKELADSVLYRKHVVGRLSAHLPPNVLKMFASLGR